MDRAVFYAVIVAGVYALGVLVVLNNAPIALVCGGLAGSLALLRGIRAWG